VASNLACVGLASTEESLEALVRHALANGEPLGSVGTTRLVRWTDPSGARLLVGVDEVVGVVSELLPLFHGRPGARLTGVTLVNDDVARADVVDDEGEQLTGLALELEQRMALRLGDPPAGPVPTVLVGLGIDVQVFPDPDAFGSSEASLLLPGGPPGPDGPPLRVAAESVFSYGVFGDDEDAEAYARLAGVVLASSRREVAYTGQAFQAVRVRTVGVELDVCLPADAHPVPPAPGGVVAGTVFLVGSLVL
jgi:hypothetical protein